MESCIEGLGHGGQAYLATGTKQALPLSALAATTGLRNSRVHDPPVGWQLRLHQAHTQHQAYYSDHDQCHDKKNALADHYDWWQMSHSKGVLCPW